MVEVIQTILPYISPSALPLVVVILGGIFIYKKIDNQRQITKAQRDADSLKIHDQLLKQEFEITNLKGQQVHHEQILEDLNKQLAILNTNVVKLQTTIENKL